MTLPDTINLKIITFPTYYIAVLILGLITLFVIWLQSVRDGFDKEKVFDVFFLSIVYLVGLYFLVNYVSLYKYYIEQNKNIILVSSFMIGTLISYKLLTMKWKWSIFRFLDIFSFLYFSLTLTVVFSQLYKTSETMPFVYVATYSAIYLITFFSRNRISSGVAFSIFLYLTSAIGWYFFSAKTHLIFYISLITISSVNLFIRSKRKMANNKLKFDLLAKIKGALLSKDKRLKDEQKKLIEDDPYLQEGRDTGNAEAMDEAILEDRAKTEIEIKKKSIGTMQKQVRSALDKIEEGNYGVCESCGIDIDKARIEAYPEATKCLKCSKLAGANS
ncbi:TraR/DksA family transcriptional regulator [Patescibacteria group bacterium]